MASSFGQQCTTQGMKAFITFPSTFWGLRTEEVLRSRGLNVVLRTAPRRLGSECGLALELDAGDVEIARDLIRETSLRVKGFHVFTGGE